MLCIGVEFPCHREDLLHSDSQASVGESMGEGVENLSEVNLGSNSDV
jgi:hypothetical protein